MSELINTHDNRATIRWKLLTGVSALALTAYISSSGVTKAEDVDRPLIWVELGGQMDMEQGLSSRFTAPFMSITANGPGDISNDVYGEGLKPPRFALGMDGKITFQPENSDWIFSAGIRYGRALGSSHAHKQGPVPSGYKYLGGVKRQPPYPVISAPFVDIKSRQENMHEIIDFSAGKDVGLGAWGHDASSNISVGVRFADFTAKSTANILARPNVNVKELPNYFSSFLKPFGTFYQYTMAAEAARSFKGVGPSLSWNASAALAGNKQDGEISLEWGIDASVLFGRQRTKTGHSTQARHLDNYDTYYTFYGITYPRHHTVYPQLYNHNHHSTRSRRVTVPNIGGFAGLSVKYTDVKVSIGYRYDTFLGAMDTGIDARKTSNVTFNGPYASISIGLGD